MNGLEEYRGDPSNAKGTLGVSGREFKVRSVSMVAYFSPATYISLGAGTE